jgi:hypothetical protein
MKMHRSLFDSVTPSLMVALLGAVVWGHAAPARAASLTSTVSVSVSGTLTTTSPAGTAESVSFSGIVQVKAVIVEDPDFGTPPIILLSFDLSGVTGVDAATGTKFVTSNVTRIQRRLTQRTDAVQFSFPFWPSGTTGITTSRVGGTSFSLSFDVLKRMLANATGSITNP